MEGIEVKQKLPTRFKKAWLKALRSGKFKKTTNTLKKKSVTEYKYCCLGVACEVVAAKIPMDQIGGYNFIQNSTYKKKIKGITGVPKILRGQNKVTEFLAEKNDSGWSFKKIATWIEKNL